MRPIALALALLPLGAQAQVIQDCQQVPWLASPANITEPWADHSRTFANGNIRVALLDTGGEPVCCAAHLLVLMPVGGQDEPVYRQCSVVSGAQGLGFFTLDVAGIAASYDPARGLLLSVPLTHWTEAVETGADPIADRMELRINQAAGTLALE